MTSRMPLALTGVLALAAAGCVSSAGADGDATSGTPPDATDVVQIEDAGSALDTTAPSDLVFSGDMASQADTVGGPTVAPTEVLFPSDRAIEVFITLDPDDWASLRAQTRTITDILGPGCLEQPFESPFTYFPATVVVDGEEVEHVGVRKKGFLGSLSEKKPSFKIKAHEYEDGKSFFGMKRLTLNNVQQDPGYVSTCLTYDLFNAAGVAAPRCGFADVTVNGEHLGLFVSIDSLKKPFMKRVFGDDSGTIYEGTLSDFREGWTGSFDQKTLESQGPGPHIAAVTDALLVPDEQLLDALDAVIDLDQFMTFWALEVVVGHWDGYAGNTNNFYLYAPPHDQRLRFLPWGADATFVPAFDLQDEKNVMPYSLLAQGLLARRLYLNPDGRQWYLSRLQWALDAVWNEEHLQSEISRMEEIMAPLLFDYEIAGALERVGSARQFIDARRAQITEELAIGGPEWDFPLRASLCWDFEAEVYVTMDTTFGTLSNDNPYENTGATWAFVPQQDDLQFTTHGVQVGLSQEPESYGEVHLRAWGLLASGESVLAVWSLPPERVFDGSAMDIDFGEVSGFLVRLSATWEVELMGYLGGSILIEEGTLVPGSPFKASVESIWFRPKDD